MICSVITSAKYGCFILYQENIIAYLNKSADSHGFPEKKVYVVKTFILKEQINLFFNVVKTFILKEQINLFFKAVFLFTKLVT